MARRGKIGTGTYVLIALGGFAGIVLLDHYVLKGKLGISGHINILIGQIKQKLGSGAGPITPAPVPEAGLPPQTAPADEPVPTDAEQIAMGEEMGYDSVSGEGEPEQALWARLKARRAARRRFYH